MNPNPATKSEHQTPRVMSLELLQQLPATQADIAAVNARLDALELKMDGIAPEYVAKGKAS